MSLASMLKNAIDRMTYQYFQSFAQGRLLLDFPQTVHCVLALHRVVPQTAATAWRADMAMLRFVLKCIFLEVNAIGRSLRLAARSRKASLVVGSIWLGAGCFEYSRWWWGMGWQRRGEHMTRGRISSQRHGGAHSAPCAVLTVITTAAAADVGLDRADSVREARLYGQRILFGNPPSLKEQTP